MHFMYLAQHLVRRASFVPPFPPNFNVARVETGGVNSSLLTQDRLATCNIELGGREGGTRRCSTPYWSLCVGEYGANEHAVWVCVVWTCHIRPHS